MECALQVYASMQKWDQHVSHPCAWAKFKGLGSRACRFQVSCATLGKMMGSEVQGFPQRENSPAVSCLEIRRIDSSPLKV